MFDAHDQVSEQVDNMSYKFQEDVCGIADLEKNEMFYNPTTKEVMLSVSIDADDGKEYMRYLLINLEDDDHSLITYKDFLNSEGFDDISDQLELV